MVDFHGKITSIFTGWELKVAPRLRTPSHLNQPVEIIARARVAFFFALKKSLRNQGSTKNFSSEDRNFYKSVTFFGLGLARLGQLSFLGELLTNLAEHFGRPPKNWMIFAEFRTRKPTLNRRDRCPGGAVRWYPRASAARRRGPNPGWTAAETGHPAVRGTADWGAQAKREPSTGHHGFSGRNYELGVIPCC